MWVCEKVVITIITGLPGSHKERLTDFLVQLNKEHGRCVRFHPERFHRFLFYFLLLYFCHIVCSVMFFYIVNALIITINKLMIVIIIIIIIIQITQFDYLFIYRWVVYKPDPDSSDSFSASHLQQFLSSFLESQRGPGGKPRLLVLSPG